MRRDSNQQKIAIAVGIALSAGMFSIVPVAYGAPVGGTVVTTTTESGATVPSATITPSGTTTKIDGKITNNVIDWQDFSVAKGETVLFDNGEKTRNYMNIVSGMNTSQIDGAIKGGNEVYIINPNGVIFGETASVDVGSLYASTRYVSSDAALTAATAGNMTTVLPDTSAGVATDVVNLGTINATKVVMEGQNVRFVNDSTKTNDGETNVADYKTTGVTASSVVLKADTADGGYIHVGNANGSNTGYTGESLTDGNDFSPVYYKLIGNSNWSEITSSGNFMLKEDITADNFTQIANFSGKFDGNFYEIKGISGVSGVFAKTTGTATNKAEIYNLGVTGATISADVDAGAIVADATYTVLKNVYNNGSSVSGVNVGGLVGNAKGGVEISNSYNTGNLGPTSEAAGFIGIVSSGTNSIKDSYSTGTARYGISFEISAGATLNVDRVHTKGSSYFSQTRGTANVTNLLMQMNNGKFIIYPDQTTAASDVDNTAIATYQSDRIAWGTAISNTGGVSIDTNRYVLDSDGNPTETINTNYGKVTRPTWRIYEGQSTPVLTSQLKGVSTVNYSYTHGAQRGSNNGADLTASSMTNDGTSTGSVLTYNGNYMEVSGTPGYGANADTSLIKTGVPDTDTGVINAKTKALFYSGQNGYDLVGNNVTMAKRKVSVSGADINLSKIYDGATDVTEEFQTAFKNSSGSGTSGGLLARDADYVEIGFTDYTNPDDETVTPFSAKFADKNVGENKVINLTGALTLSAKTDSDDTPVAGAAERLANYELDSSSANLLNTNAYGTITARPIYLVVTEPADGLNKTYDGNNNLASTLNASNIFSLENGENQIGTQIPAHGKIAGDTVSLAVGTSTPMYVDVDDAGNINTDTAVNAGKHKIMFSNIALAGADKNNYVLQYETTHNEVTNSQVFLDGVIKPRLLSKDGFQVKTKTGTDEQGNPVYTVANATKVYDGTSTYTVPDNAVLVANTGSTSGDTGMIANDAEHLWFELSDTGNSYFVSSFEESATDNHATKMAAGDNAAIGVKYVVDAVTGSTDTTDTTDYSVLKKNYTFYQDTADSLNPGEWVTLGTETVNGIGSISKRDLVINSTNAVDINKTYNATDKVEGSGFSTVGGEQDKLQYTAGSAKLLADVQDEQGNPIVSDSAAWDITATYSDKHVGDLDSNGNAVDNAKTLNIVVALSGDDAVNYTINGGNSATLTGTGKIERVSISPVFDDVTKEYNGTTRINDGENTTVSGNGRVTPITVTDGESSIVDDVRLVYSDDNAYYASADAGSHAVYYPGLSLEGNDSRNYKLSSTTGEGAGTITQRTVEAGDIMAAFADIEKTYNNDTDIDNSASKLLNLTINGILENGDVRSNVTNVSGAFVNKNRLNGTDLQTNGVQYVITIPSNLSTNYSFANGSNAAGTVTIAGEGNNKTITLLTDGKIYQAPITATRVNNNPTKYYNGTDKLVNNLTDINNNTELTGNDLVALTGLYTEDGTGNATTAVYGGVNAGTQTVTYTLALSEAAGVNNYKFVDDAGNTITTISGENITGTILQRPLSVSFGYVNKQYDGNNQVTNTYYNNTYSDVITPTVTGALSGDVDTITALVKAGVTGAYKSTDSTPDENVGNKTVEYSGLSTVLSGSLGTNYAFSSDTAAGSGRIGKATIGMSDLKFTFADIEKEYDATPNIDAAYANTKVTGHYIDLGGDNHVDFGYNTTTLSAAYTSSGTGSSSEGVGTGKQVKYTVSGITIPDSVLTNFDWDTEDPFVSSKTYVIDNVGTIKPRTVYATINDTITKTYDGGLAVIDKALPTAGGNVISQTQVENNQSVVKIDGLVGNTKNTSVIEYTDKNRGNDKDVTYTVSVSDGENYNIYYNSNNNISYDLVNNTDGTLNRVTTHNNVITSKDLKLTFGTVTKIYDGTTDVLADELANKTNLFGAVNGETVSLASGVVGTYTDANVADGISVNYDGLQIIVNGSADTYGNYRLVDGSGNPLANGTTGKKTSGLGNITPLELNGALNFTLQNVSKEYDKTAKVAYTDANHVRHDTLDDIKNNSGYIVAPTIEAIGQALPYVLESANYVGNSPTTVGTDKTVEYGVGFRAGNYTFGTNFTINGQSLPSTPSADGMYHITLSTADAASPATAEITKRHIYVALKDSPLIRKEYDGFTTVTTEGATDKVYMPTESTDILQNDDVRLANVGAAYRNKDAGNNVDVIYTVELGGTDAGNYALYRSDGVALDNDDVNRQLVGQGIITKAKLTVAAVDKVYDGNYNVEMPVTLIGVNNEQQTLSDGAVSLVTGNYGKGSSAASFTPDANVSWNGNTVADKDIVYEGLADAVQYMMDNAQDGGIFKNYTIDNTLYFAAAEKKGKIKPISITQAAAEHWTPITREYNAGKDVEAVYERNNPANQLGINDILQLTVDDINNNPLIVTYEATANYDNKNVGDNHTLNYHINSVQKKVTETDNNGNVYANYVLADSVINGLAGQNLTSAADNQITPRIINASVVNARGNRKIYDGNANASTANYKIDDDDLAVIAKDNRVNGANVNAIVTARYGDKHASANPGETTNSKEITYSLALNAANDNYTIATPSATAKGDIERRKVYVEGVNVNGIDKVYDSTAAMADDFSSTGRFALKKADANTGIVTGETDIYLDVSGVKDNSSYASAHVKRGTDGTAMAQEIQFAGFKLGDSNTANNNYADDYLLTGKVAGSGTITPRALSVSLGKAPTKVYDGKTTITGTAAANSNLRTTGLLKNDTANILIESSAYNDTNAGTNKGYTYNISLGNGDYKLVQGAGQPVIAVTDKGRKGKITASDGTITPRTLTASVIASMNKEYDGTVNGTENAAANISLGNVLSGENVGLTAKAVYDNPNAGKSEDSDELQNHRVTYTLNLSNPNYQLADDTVTGTGTISRKGLNIVATSVSINNGEAMPKFSGTVEGLVSGDENLTSSFVFDTLPTVTNVSVGSNPVYGWYRNSYDDGNLGLNYTYQQAPANATAFTVKYVDSGRNNPDTKITPTHNVYQQISKDKGSGFGDNAAAALEYVDKNGQVIARETIDSGEIHDGGASIGNADDMTSQDTSLANIGIVGGDIVNVDGADAANMANIEVTDNGTTVNLEITSLSSGESGDKQAVAEITSVPAAADNSSAQIQNLDDRQDILEQITNKEEEQEKEGEIAIESKSSQNDDEIELTVEGNGVNVA